MRDDDARQRSPAGRTWQMPTVRRPLQPSRKLGRCSWRIRRQRIAIGPRSVGWSRPRAGCRRRT